MKLITHYSLLKSESGQLLTEVLVAVAVGGLLLVSAVGGIVSVIRQNYESRSSQASATFAYDLINTAKTFAASDWHNLYDLNHGSANPYYIISSATSSLAVSGQESVLSNDVSAGLVGYWKMDEATGTIAYDSSGSGNIGTLVNGPTRQTGTNCPVGGCLSFNSTNSQYVSVASSGSLSGSYTVMAWGNPSNTSAMDLVGTRSPSDASFDMKFQSGNLIHGDIGSGTAWITTTANASFNYSVGQWYHVVYVVTPSGYTIYVNGNQVGSGTYATSTPLLYDATHAIKIGQVGGGGEFFNGSIDDVRIYNRALSANEISQIYNSSVYTRYFYVDNVNRTQCGVGDISTSDVSGCTSVLGAGSGDIANDPSTQKINIVVTRADGARYQFYSYLTRSRNSITTQNDWSGGSGQVGPITVSNNKYSTSTNITAGKTLLLASNSSSGALYSSIFDTQSASGAGFNGIVWNGTNASSSSVAFQFATSNSTSTGWTYVGPGGTSLSADVYTAAPNTAMTINPAYHNNARYFAYKIILNPDSGYTTSPAVSGVNINWLP